jgi:serine phosphatase RsbU (regulator of sigma subunit)
LALLGPRVAADAPGRLTFQRDSLMNLLVAWDDPEELELLRLYLSAPGNAVGGALTRDELQERLAHGPWEAVLLALTFRTPAEGVAALEQVQQAVPGVPVVVACREEESRHLPRFLARGVRSHLLRDGGGNFVFLVLSVLEAAADAARAEEARKLAERLREEMEGVRRLQESIIPRGLMPPSGYRVAARYEPAQVNVLGDRPVVLAGGDYYDLFCPDERTLVVLLGDASGHGLKACMSIMTMHTLIRMMPGDCYRDTAAFVGEINQRLCENSIVQSDGGFITLFYAAIDTHTHTMTWTSAGHPLPLMHLLETDEVITVGAAADGGLPLGISRETGYTSARLDLAPASRVLLYTDGLAEAFPLGGSRHQAFGIRGITDALRAGRGGELEAVRDQLLAASFAFTDGSGRHDDTSVVLLERAAPSPLAGA